MKRPWIPEREVSGSLARSLIEAQLDLRIDSIAVLGEGWDNIAYLVNGELVFRFPRRKLGARCMAAEIAVLPQIGSLPLQIPRLDWIGAPTGDYPWPFAGYRMLPGQTACAANLSEEERLEAAPILGETLRALHSLSIEAPPDRIGKLDLTKRVPQNVARLHEIEGDVDIAHYIRILESTTSSPHRPRALIHGDLYARHLMIDRRRVTGIIDWGDVETNDRAVDLSIAYGFLPPRAREAFFAAYGDVDPETHALARFRAIHIGVALVIYGREIDDRDLVREGLLALRYAR